MNELDLGTGESMQGYLKREREDKSTRPALAADRVPYVDMGSDFYTMAVVRVRRFRAVIVEEVPDAHDSD